jgi:GTP pyrophosphokinase
MAGNTEPTYPGGSKRRVTRAGDAVRQNAASLEDLTVIEVWRGSHRAVLNTFQSILRNRTRGKDIIVAQRHKRRKTIFDKLHRLPKMELARMDDIAGCRLIFENIAELYAFRAEMHKAKFDHSLRNNVDRYDYIKFPKQDTGYRGIHDVYEYNVRSETGKHYKGLYVEIQYRTLVQHAWATAVEVVGILTENEPKFQRGDERYERMMALASEILARAHEASVSCFPTMTDDALVHEFVQLDEEVRLMDLLRSRNPESSEDSVAGNVILMLVGKETVESEEYRTAPEALRALFKYEEENPGADVVLVRAGSPEEVRTAFRNYFTDTAEFVRLLEEGCQKLSGRDIYYFGTDDNDEEGPWDEEDG